MVDYSIDTGLEVSVIPEALNDFEVGRGKGEGISIKLPL